MDNRRSLDRSRLWTSAATLLLLLSPPGSAFAAPDDAADEEPPSSEEGADDETNGVDGECPCADEEEAALDEADRERPKREPRRRHSKRGRRVHEADPIDPYSWEAFDPYPERTHFSVRFGPRFAIHGFGGEDVYAGAGVATSIGADTRAGFYGFFASFDAGQASSAGMRYGEFDLGVDLAWTAGAFHLGLRPTFGYFGGQAAVYMESGGSPDYYVTWEAMKVGVGGVLGVDFYRSRDWTIGLEAEPRVDALLQTAVYESFERSVGMYSLNVALSIKYQKPRRAVVIVPFDGEE